MTTIEELFAVIERSMGVGRVQHPLTKDPILTLPSDHEARQALEALRQRVTDLEALSDAVDELSKIEKAYTRLSDNTWPEWDDAYDSMYAINKRIRGEVKQG